VTGFDMRSLLDLPVRPHFGPVPVRPSPMVGETHSHVLPGDPDEPY
jgi:hypothetical protein